MAYSVTLTLASWWSTTKTFTPPPPTTTSPHASVPSSPQWGTANAEITVLSVPKSHSYQRFSSRTRKRVGTRVGFIRVKNRSSLDQRVGRQHTRTSPNAKNSRKLNEIPCPIPPTPPTPTPPPPHPQPLLHSPPQQGKPVTIHRCHYKVIGVKLS